MFGLFKRKKRPQRKSGSRKTPVRGTRTQAEKAQQRRKSKVNRRVQNHRKRRGDRFYWVNRESLSWALATFFSISILGLLAVAYFLHDLPNVSTMMEIRKPPSIILTTQSGEIIGNAGDIYGDFIRYNDIPRDMVKALVATEDRNFFRHFGIDPLGLLRAAFANFRAGRIVQGGSTLTQQLAKNVFLTPERSLKRKIQEVILSLQMERDYSKEQILSVYLNRVYFGAGSYGIDAAARRYFGKSATRLNLEESALIVGLLKAPSRYAPSNSPERAIGRGTQVILNMVDAELLDEEEAKKAIARYKKMKFQLAGISGNRYFADWVIDQVPEHVGNIQSDLTVITTFDSRLQKAAEEAASNILSADEAVKAKAGQVALVSMTPSGAVRAMVGGRSYAKSQYNRAAQAVRQPGSAFKLFVYLAALEAGYDPNSLVEDAPITVGKWSPSNYTGRYEGVVSMRHAFAQSLNAAAVRLSEEVGRQNVIRMAYRLGLSADMEPVPSIALGVTETTPLEMTTAFAHLASEGRIVLPYGIEEIRNAQNKVLYRRSNSSLGRVLQPGIVARANELLSAVVEEGTGRAAAIGRPAAGKTGTSQDFRDAWFVGYTPQLVTGVWVGNDNNTSMSKVSGGKYPAQIWREYMKVALAGQPVQGLMRERYGEDMQQAPGRSRNFFLPWRSSSEQPRTMDQQLNERRRPLPEPKEGPELHDSFWELLESGESTGKVEYEYPKPRR